MSLSKRHGLFWANLVTGISDTRGIWRKNFSASEYTVAIETIAEYDPMAAYSINEHSTIGSLGLVNFGTEAKRKNTSIAASGKLVAAFGLSEPEHGSDVDLITTSAVKKEINTRRVGRII